MKIFLIAMLCILMLNPSFSNASELRTTHPLYKKAIISLIEENKEQAIIYLTEAAEDGDKESKFLLAVTLLEKEKTGDNSKEGLKWLTEAAKTGDFRAQQMLDLREKYK